jgi:dihydrofolate reductase
MLKLLLAVSADGFLSKDTFTGLGASETIEKQPQRTGVDTMSWTGPMDKFVFKLLTLSSSLPILAGSNTAASLPPLTGRQVIPISRQDKPGSMTLHNAFIKYDGAWLIGGPSIAREAFQRGMVDQVVLSVVPAKVGQGIPLTNLIEFIPSSPFMSLVVPGCPEHKIHFYTAGQIWPGR